MLDSLLVSVRRYSLLIVLLLALLLASCNGNAAPTAVALAVTRNPNIENVIPLQQVALVSGLDAGQSVIIHWHVEEGGAGGTLSKDTGSATIYTAGNKAGVDIVVAEAIDSRGNVVGSESVTFSVTAPTDTPPAPTSLPTPAPRPTREPCARLRLVRITLSAPPAQGHAEFTDPENCVDDLPINPERIEARGTYTSEFEGKALWVLLYISNLYFPQAAIDEQCNVFPAESGQGQWKSDVGFGTTPGNPDIFAMVLVVTDRGSTADERFIEWNLDGCKTGKFPGIGRNEILSLGLTELDSITVRAPVP